MNGNGKAWKSYFLFCLGLFAGTAFCMKWMEGDLQVNGQVFTVIGLEVSYPREKITELFSGMDERVRTILRYHLHFDYAFMAGVYPGIAVLCLWARQRSKAGTLRRVLLVAALLQAPALACDVMENGYLLNWLRDPVIGKEFTYYHAVVYTKWILALSAILLSVPVLLLKKRRG